MKRMKLFFVAAIATCHIFPGSLRAQTDDSEIDMPVVGIGLHVIPFSTFANSGIYSTTVLVPLNLTQHFRLEPEIGIVMRNNETDNETDIGFSSGLGAFYMFQRGKVNFYLGGRLGYDNGKTEGSYSFNDNSGIRKYTAYKVSPTLGFEYFINRNFSFGGELGLTYVNSKATLEFPTLEEFPEEWYNEETKESMFGFASGIFVRAYF